MCTNRGSTFGTLRWIPQASWLNPMKSWIQISHWGSQNGLAVWKNWGRITTFTVVWWCRLKTHNHGCGTYADTLRGDSEEFLASSRSKSACPADVCWPSYVNVCSGLIKWVNHLRSQDMYWVPPWLIQWVIQPNKPRQWINTMILHTNRVSKNRSLIDFVGFRAVAAWEGCSRDSRVATLAQWEEGGKQNTYGDQLQTCQTQSATTTVNIHKINPAIANERGDIEIKDYVVLPRVQFTCPPPHPMMGQMNVMSFDSFTLSDWVIVRGLGFSWDKASAMRVSILHSPRLFHSVHHSTSSLHHWVLVTMTVPPFSPLPL
jgi:hypothetical protein